MDSHTNNGSVCPATITGHHGPYDIAFLNTGRIDAYAVTITCTECGAIRLDDFAVDAYVMDRDDDSDLTWTPALRVEIVNRTGREVAAMLDGVHYAFAGALDVAAPTPPSAIVHRRHRFGGT